MTNDPSSTPSRSRRTTDPSYIFSPTHASPSSPAITPRIRLPTPSSSSPNHPNRRRRHQSPPTSPLLRSTVHLHNLATIPPTSPIPPTTATRTTLARLPADSTSMTSFPPQRFPAAGPSSSSSSTSSILQKPFLSSRSAASPALGAWGKPVPTPAAALHIPAYLADTAFATLAEEQARRAQSEIQTTRGWEKIGKPGQGSKAEPPLRLPSAWNPKDKCDKLELSLDGARIEYKGTSYFFLPSISSSSRLASINLNQPSPNTYALSTSPLPLFFFFLPVQQSSTSFPSRPRFGQGRIGRRSCPCQSSHAPTMRFVLLGGRYSVKGSRWIHWDWVL